MIRVLKRMVTAVTLFLFIGLAALAQTDEIGFDVETFRELATRAEGVVSDGQASTKALEILRSDLVKFRSQALTEQEARAQRVDTVKKQIAVLGSVPEGELSESVEIAVRRAELNGQLAEARAPLIVAQEAFGRSSGLIGEIDKIVRARKKTALLELESTPLNPVLWPKALKALTKHISAIGTEVKSQWAGKNPAQLRKQNGPAILLLLILGLILIVPVMRWITHRLESAKDKDLNKIGDLPRLLLSLAIFILPMIGLILILAAIDLADLFSVRGDLLVRTMPLIGLSLFGANWLARNLPQGKIYSGESSAANTRLVLGGQRTIWAVGVVIALYYLLDGLANGANWSTDVLSVLRFPLVVLLGIGLIRGAREIKIYRNSIRIDDGIKSVPERMATLFMWACYIAGIVGPLMAVLGYSNAGATLVFSMTLTVAFSATIFFFYILLVRFINRAAERDEAKAEEQPTGGLYKVGLAFALICISVPVFALIWGASTTDISNLWVTLNEGVALGDTRISISDVLIFILIFSIGYTITRLLQSALRTTVLPNTRIESGAQNALVTGFGYIGIFLASLIAIMTTGLDLSNLAIVAGALSVGIGFGLQAIVSNFVSGIILLIERPVKIGDWVEVGTYSGYISNISVRSTSIDTFDGATVILPNADLVAGTVTNWTHGNLRGRVKVPIGVAYGTDPELVKEVLLSIADDHPVALKLPKPQVVFMGFGADSMNFELRAILRDVNYVLATVSDMNFEIVKRFAAEGIEIPFAQRVVTIKNPEDLLPKPTRRARKTTSKPKA